MIKYNVNSDPTESADVTVYSIMEKEYRELSIDDIKLWTVNGLKDFLRNRNLNVSGRKS